MNIFLTLTFWLILILILSRVFACFSALLTYRPPPFPFQLLRKPWAFGIHPLSLTHSHPIPNLSLTTSLLLSSPTPTAISPHPLNSLSCLIPSHTSITCSRSSCSHPHILHPSPSPFHLILLPVSSAPTLA